MANVTLIKATLPCTIACYMSDQNHYVAIESIYYGFNYHGIMATVQATMFAVIIPITVGLHQAIIEEGRLKRLMIKFIIQESKLFMLTVSSIFFIGWVVLLEFFKATVEGFNISSLTNSIEYCWFIFNIVLIGYFLFTAINLFNRSSFDAAIRGYIVNHLYPREMQGYLARNIYIGLSRNSGESDEEN